jgi:hypothetical protein
MSDSSNALDDYLSQLRGKGNFDSEGVFTVAGTRALGKLAAFLLPNKSDWILKIVQGACGAEAPEIRIKQTHRSTQISFQAPYPVDLDLFERYLLVTGSQTEDRGLHDFTSGLRAVGMGQQQRDWVARLTVGDNESFLSCVEGQLTSQRFQLESPGPEDITQIALGIAYPANESGKLGGLIRFGEAVQNEHAALLLKTRVCPVPLLLDGERLDNVREPNFASALQQRVFLGINACTQQGWPSLQIPSGLVPFKSPPEAKAFFSNDPYLVPHLPLDGLATSIQRWYYNYSRREQPGKEQKFLQAVPTPSRVHLVRRGVVVGSKSVGVVHPISADIFISADHLRSDLSGLQVSPGNQEADLAKEGMRQSLGYLGHLEDLLAEIKTRPFSRDVAMYGGLGALALLSPWFALKAVAGTVSGVMLFKAAKADHRVLSDCREQLHDFLLLTRAV